MLWPYYRRLIGACLINNRIYTFGGICENKKDLESSSASIIEMNDDSKDFESRSWFSDVVEYYHIALDRWFPCLKLPFADACSAITISAKADVIFILIHGRGCFEYNIIR